jgi:hypothetical protein
MPAPAKIVNAAAGARGGNGGVSRSTASRRVSRVALQGEPSSQRLEADLPAFPATAISVSEAETRGI